MRNRSSKKIPKCYGVTISPRTSKRLGCSHCFETALWSTKHFGGAIALIERRHGPGHVIGHSVTAGNLAALARDPPATSHEHGTAKQPARHPLGRPIDQLLREEALGAILSQTVVGKVLEDVRDLFLLGLALDRRVMRSLLPSLGARLSASLDRRVGRDQASDSTDRSNRCLFTRTTKQGE